VARRSWFPRAASHLGDGYPAAEGVEEETTFVATRAGKFLLACGVSGNTPSGMWLRFTVDAQATRPAYR
jgi:hypothetical protein